MKEKLQQEESLAKVKDELQRTDASCDTSKKFKLLDKHSILLTCMY
jgi:hypothetical protein